MLLPVLFALLGHGFLWVALVNRSHSTAMPYALARPLTVAMFALAGGIPLGLAAWFAAAGLHPLRGHDWLELPWPATLYAAVCCGCGLVALAAWVRRRVFSRPPTIQRFEHGRRLEMPSLPGNPAETGPRQSWLARLPGNEIATLELVERGLQLPRLPPALDGLTILLLSDLHFTGQVGKEYFRHVVRACNAIRPDLVAIVGDLIDDDAYIPWVQDTVAGLVAPGGVYFVLGNHDSRHDAARLRRALVDGGLVDLGGRWQQIEIRGQPIVLAGNELPWFSPAADLQSAPPPCSQGGPPRIVLAHSPDQLPWARGRDVDLLLAGHSHGGQIRLPLVGPVFAPSRWGLRHVYGVYHVPPTVLCVTRGVSAKLPLRWNCPPEVVKLTLYAGTRVFPKDPSPGEISRGC